MLDWSLVNNALKVHYVGLRELYERKWNKVFMSVCVKTCTYELLCFFSFFVNLQA